jgi:hypothetical protein
MMATGVVLLAIGWLLAKIYSHSTNAGEWIAGAFIATGMALLTVGLVMWLWRYAP